MEKAPPTKRPRYDAAFRAEALRLACESRSAQAADRALNIRPQHPPRAALPMAAGGPSPVAPQTRPKRWKCGPRAWPTNG